MEDLLPASFPRLFRLPHAQESVFQPGAPGRRLAPHPFCSSSSLVKASLLSMRRRAGAVGGSGRWRRHAHGRRGLVLVVDGDARGDGEAGLDLVVLLDDGAAGAPVRRAAVTHGAAGDLEAVADLGTLHHGVDPAAAGEPRKQAVDHTLRIHQVRCRHRGVAHAVRRLADHCSLFWN